MHSVWKSVRLICGALGLVLGGVGTTATFAAGAVDATDAATQRCADYLFVGGMDNAAGVPCHVAGSTAIYTDRAAFLAALAAGRIENAFDDVVAGASGGLNYSKNRVDYLIYTQFFSDGALYNGPGFVSTDRVGDSIVIYLSGDPVTAIGGNFWPNDFFLAPAEGSIDVLLDDGTVESIKSAVPDSFRGFISATPIGRLTIDAPAVAPVPPGESPDRWPALDNLVIGNGR
jgi:hypothetical protein